MEGYLAGDDASSRWHPMRACAYYSAADMISCSFRAKIWLYAEEGGFVAFPKHHGKRLRIFATPSRRGWGSYVLPLKASIRKAAGVEVGQAVHIKLDIQTP